MNCCGITNPSLFFQKNRPNLFNNTSDKAMREKCSISTKTKARKFGSHILETNAKNSMEIIHQNGRKVAK